jgi:hypothetical protein
MADSDVLCVIGQAYVDTAVCSVISGCTSSNRFEKIAESTLNRFAYLRRILASFGDAVGEEIFKNFNGPDAFRDHWLPTKTLKSVLPSSPSSSA